MLSEEENNLLCCTGPGTPMGNLFRRFWLPVALSRELPKPDCPPVHLRILSEDLIAFRDTNGRVGLLSRYCPHRGASLFFGRKPTAQGRVMIRVGDDIDLQNSNQIVWALSTRLRPDKDVIFGDNGRIVFDTTQMSEKLEVPSLPNEVIERIANKLREARPIAI